MVSSRWTADQRAKVFKALSHGLRLAIVDSLAVPKKNGGAKKIAKRRASRPRKT